MIAAAQGIFQNELLRDLRKTAPGLNPLIVLSLEASSDAAKALPQESLGVILKAYALAIRRTFILAIPIAGIAFIVSFFQPWFKYHKPDATGKEKPIGTEEPKGGDTKEEISA